MSYHSHNRCRCSCCVDPCRRDRCSRRGRCHSHHGGHSHVWRNDPCCQRHTHRCCRDYDRCYCCNRGRNRNRFWF